MSNNNNSTGIVIALVLFGIFGIFSLVVRAGFNEVSKKMEALNESAKVNSPNLQIHLGDNAAPVPQEHGPKLERTTTLTRAELALLDKLVLSKALLQPDIELNDGQHMRTGKAWCTQLNNKKVVVSALHLLSQDGGLNRSIPAALVKSSVKSVEFSNPANGRPVGKTFEILSKSGAPYDLASKTSDCATDIVIMGAPNTKPPIKPLVVSKEPANVGEQVWLCTRTSNSIIQLYPATVSQSGERGLIIQLQLPGSLEEQSGLPVVNADLKVVGMVIAYDASNKGMVLCNPGCAIYKHLRTDIGLAKDLFEEPKSLRFPEAKRLGKRAAK